MCITFFDLIIIFFIFIFLSVSILIVIMVLFTFSILPCSFSLFWLFFFGILSSKVHFNKLLLPHHHVPEFLHFKLWYSFIEQLFVIFSWLWHNISSEFSVSQHHYCSKGFIQYIYIDFFQLLYCSLENELDFLAPLFVEISSEKYMFCCQLCKYPWAVQPFSVGFFFLQLLSLKFLFISTYSLQMLQILFDANQGIFQF